jgi:hypothetical protein
MLAGWVDLGSCSHVALHYDITKSFYSAYVSV